MKYRPEIDGLRAVAVIPVILFHASFSTFSGGFVGVDVFFVISGYLITTIILSEMEQGTFSLVNFYERRARRILPALFLVMLVSLPFAWLWMLPSDMKDFSQSLVAVSTFSSNILFLHESGYWDAASEMKPLLHTWSLAVEEQYYVLFPLFLMIMWHFRKRWILGSFLLVAGISLVTAQWGAYHKPSPTFYLLPTRGWELAIGAGIAFYFLYRKQAIRTLLSHKIVDEMLGLLGLLLIGYAVFTFDETIPFPSLYALVPTIGTGLIILFSSSQTMIGRFLSTKPLVAIGLISYSAYLWHQPLLVFTRHRTLTEPSELTFAIMASLSIPLAYLSWQYVEKPFRIKCIVNRKAIFLYSMVGSTAFIAIGLAGHLTNGFDGRTTNSKLSADLIEQKLKVNHGLSETCEGKFTLSSDCRTNDKPEILIWGDSYAMHLVQGIMASKPDAKIVQMTKSFCGPFFDVAPIIEPKYPASWGQDCLEFTNEVRRWIKENKTVKYAVLSSPFEQYLKKDSKLLLRTGKLLPAAIKLAAKEFEKTLNELERLGITPIVFSPPPANGINLGKCLAKGEWRGLNLDGCDFAVSEISEGRLLAHDFLDIIKENHSVVFLDELICNDSLCKTHFDNVFIYRDPGHLSHEGSAELGKRFDFYKMIVDK
jgi:peptidoglycan/LPS O-acetylase OafA/YrhL